MNKVVFIAGILTVSVVGGIFFCAGMFMNSYMGSKADTKEALVDQKTEEKDSKDDTKKKEEESFFGKIANLMPGKEAKEAEAAAEAEYEKQQNAYINLDSLLNEIIATHDTSDQCLTENVKSLNKEPIILNNTKKYLLYIGYFENDVCNDVAQLMMAKGYPIHIQKSQTSTEASYVFCGPFKKKLNAQKILTWLKQNGFTGAKMVSQDPQKPNDINIEAIDDNDDSMPVNADVRQRNAAKDETQKTTVDSETIKAPSAKTKKKKSRPTKTVKEVAQSTKRVVEDDLEEETSEKKEEKPSTAEDSDDKEASTDEEVKKEEKQKAEPKENEPKEEEEDTEGAESAVKEAE